MKTFYKSFFTKSQFKEAVAIFEGLFSGVLNCLQIESKLKILFCKVEKHQRSKNKPKVCKDGHD